jgi:hypothetical protein
MTIQDIINGSYESLGGVFIWLSVFRLFKDKQVKGISLLTVFFFTTWGIWNCYFYPFLGQMASFAGGVFTTSANMVWISMMVYYTYFYKGALAQ